MITHELHYAAVELLDSSADGSGGVPEILPGDDPRANCVISLLEDGRHVPLIDIDFPARLVPSSTPGHFHLYLDGIALEPHQYMKLLNVLNEVGILEEGNVFRFIRDGISVLRREGVTK